MSMKSLQGRRTPGSRDECRTAALIGGDRLRRFRNRSRFYLLEELREKPQAPLRRRG